MGLGIVSALGAWMPSQGPSVHWERTEQAVGPAGAWTQVRQHWLEAPDLYRSTGRPPGVTGEVRGDSVARGQLYPQRHWLCLETVTSIGEAALGGGQGSGNY